MKTILITGAGGVAFPFLVKLLKKQGYRVIAVDMDKYAVGLYLADKGYVVPKGDDPSFTNKLKSICDQEKVNVVVPLVDEELLAAKQLEKYGFIVLLPNREFITTCLDKYQLMQKLGKTGIMIPKTTLASELSISNIDRYPVIIKPRVGRGSRGVQIVSDHGSLMNFLKQNETQLDSLIIQEYIEGREFTISVVVWRDSIIQAIVPKEVICKHGVTRIAVTKKENSIDSLCKEIQLTMKADGPYNLQLIIDNETGIPIPFEINPRFSTSISLTVAAGVDEIGGLIGQGLNNQKHLENKWREEIVMLRQTKDEFINYKKFQLIKSTDLDNEEI